MRQEYRPCPLRARGEHLAVPADGLEGRISRLGAPAWVGDDPHDPARPRALPGASAVLAAKTFLTRSSRSRGPCPWKMTSARLLPSMIEKPSRVIATSHATYRLSGIAASRAQEPCHHCLPVADLQACDPSAPVSGCVSTHAHCVRASLEQCGASARRSVPVATSTPAVSPPAAELSTGLGAPGPEPVDGEGEDGLVRVDVPEGDHADRVRAAGVDHRDSFVLLDVVGDDEGPTA
jgi:hypothetical protein